MTVAELHELLLPDGTSDEADQFVLEALDKCRENIDTDEDVLHDALAAGPWGLRSVQVSGFRGAANAAGAEGSMPDPLLLEFPRSAPVVLVHAPNGTGKSTITDALDVALRGGVSYSYAFNPSDMRRPVAVHAGAARAEIVVVLGNDRDDHLRITWRSTAGGEDVEVAWLPAGDPHGTVERPGAKWAESIAAHHPVVGYDHMTHRLRAGNLTDFVHDTLSLGSTWWKLWDLLRAEYEAALRALERWSQSRDDVATALADLDEDLAHQHPEVRVPEAIELPESPAEDVTIWFTDCFGSDHDVVPGLNVDPYLAHGIAEALKSAKTSVDGYRRVREQSDRGLWTGEGLAALRELMIHTSDHQEHRCPVCDGATSEWRETAQRTLQDLRLVREEFNLAQADLTELGDLLVERLLPLLKSADQAPEVATTTHRLRVLIEPMIGRRPRSDQDSAWRALDSVLEDDAFERDVHAVLSELRSASDVLEHWRAARRQHCLALLAAHSEYGCIAARVDERKIALERVAAAFDGVHRDRRDIVESKVGEPLRALLADLDFDGLTLQVGMSDHQALNESTTLSMSMYGRETVMGMLSAGQYNALVLALLLGEDESGPFRFLVLDDPIHAFDDFRIDVFAQLVAEQAGAGRQIVLLTHDQQMVEVMRHHVRDLHLIKLGRDPHGNIVHIDASHPWQPLVADARAVLGGNAGNGGDHRVLSATTTGLLVLAFCRQAVDAALRQFVMDVSRPAVTDIQDALDRLNKAFSTKDSLKAALRVAGRQHPAAELINAVLRETAYMNELNSGAHGDPLGLVVTPAHLLERIDRTERFCSELLNTVAR
ncbi:AAA family ATPase [Saccharopolyspora sp. NPDC050389]|uniref:AAA family ATPase n=1 Tax=Saccharopolyspora sp. NPDC050389 TaxID=3155516 RepID=UPI0033EE3637